MLIILKIRWFTVQQPQPSTWLHFPNCSNNPCASGGNHQEQLPRNPLKYRWSKYFLWRCFEKKFTIARFHSKSIWSRQRFNHIWEVVSRYESSTLPARSGGQTQRFARVSLPVRVPPLPVWHPHLIDEVLPGPIYSALKLATRQLDASIHDSSLSPTTLSSLVNPVEAFMIQPIRLNLNEWCCALDLESTIDGGMLWKKSWEHFEPTEPGVLWYLHIMTCRWVFKVKRNSDGSFAQRKAWLVARGFNQIEGLDFHETFSPVIKFKIIRLILSIAVTQNWCLQQLDN